MNQSNHTPLPLIFTTHFSFGTPEMQEMAEKAGIKPVRALQADGSAIITDAEGVGCISVSAKTPFKRGTGHQHECAQRDELAALIVKAVNAHQKLVDALREQIAWAESVEGHEVSRNITKGPQSIFAAARALLAELEGK